MAEHGSGGVDARRRRSRRPGAGSNGRTPASAAAPGANASASTGATAVAGASSGAPLEGASTEAKSELLGSGNLTGSNADLATMLDRADAQLGAQQQLQEAKVPITVENFPGLCMGASMLMSLSMHKIGFDALTESEGQALTGALLKNVQAWELDQYLENPRVAAGADLLGCLVAMLMPRIIADAKKRQPKSPTQEHAAASDAPLAAAA
jgi:hypothetical protein